MIRRPSSPELPEGVPGALILLYHGHESANVREIISDPAGSTAIKIKESNFIIVCYVGIDADEISMTDPSAQALSNASGQFFP